MRRRRLSGTQGRTEARRHRDETTLGSGVGSVGAVVVMVVVAVVDSGKARRTPRGRGMFTLLWLAGWCIPSAAGGRCRPLGPGTHLFRAGHRPELLVEYGVYN